MPRPETPLLTVDCVLIDDSGRILFIKRKHPPFEGALALPGGFVDVGETVEDACRRELKEETGVSVRKLRLVGVYSDPLRDPRGHTASVAFWARATGRERVKAGDDAADALWALPRGKSIAFDHARIVRDALRLAR